MKHPAVSPRPLGLGLRSGLPAYFEEEIEAFRVLEAVSSVYTRMLAGLYVQPVHGRLALLKRP